jgi:hypothetical protein
MGVSSVSELVWLRRNSIETDFFFLVERIKNWELENISEHAL